MKKFNHSYQYFAESGPFDQSYLVSAIVATECQNVRGEIERHDRAIKTLTSILDYLVSKMSDEEVVQFANFFAFDEIVEKE